MTLCERVAVPQRASAHLTTLSPRYSILQNIRLARTMSLLQQRHRLVVRRATGGNNNPSDSDDDFGGELRKWFGIDPSNSPTPSMDQNDDIAQSMFSVDMEDDSVNPTSGDGINRPVSPSSSISDLMQNNPGLQKFLTAAATGAGISGIAAASAAINNSSSTASSSSSNGGGSSDPANKAKSAINDWSASPAEDWDEWSGTAVADLDDEEDIAELREQVLKRRRSRRGKRTTVRDEYLRPIVDVTGIRNRLAFDERETEERVFTEAITNQYESREGLKYAATLIAVPLTVGFLISRLVAQPLWAWAEDMNPNAFAPSDRQKVQGAEQLHREELRLRMEADIGQAPPLNDETMLLHLKAEARNLATEFKESNRRAMLNVVSDSVSAATLFVMLLQDNFQRAILFRTIGRVFSGMSDTAKAFLIILTTDILLGYHSEEGWTAGVNLLSGHYGIAAERENLQIFVATVPVFLDSMFKYWIFVELNKIDPAAAVTLRQMDRH